LKKITAPLFACGLLMAATSSFAQPTKGSGTFTLSGMVNTSIPKDGDPTANGMFNLGIGKFIGSRTQISIGPTLNISAGNNGLPGESSISASLGASVGIKQLFGGAASKTFPYVGLQASVPNFGSGGLGGLDLDLDGDGISDGGNDSLLAKMFVGTSVGFKSYLKESVALDLGAHMGAPANNLSAGLRNVSLVASIEYIF
jgi:hypothetical protein